MVEGFIEELRTSPYRNGGESVPPINTGKPSVLVVEDNPEMNRLFIAESLSERV